MTQKKSDAKRIAPTGFRQKMIVACVGVALAELGSGSALADSAIGVDTALGNWMNPPGRSAIPRPVTEESLDTIRHSPTGQLYGVPYDATGEGANKTESGWEYSGGVEAGVLGGDADKKNALTGKYRDLKKGAYLNYFEGEAEKPDTANYIQAFGGGSGQNDQFYGLQFGRYNDWKVKLFYNEIKHVFTDTYKPLFNGSGTGNLTLAGGLKPNGGATFYTFATNATRPAGAPACANVANTYCVSYTSLTGVQQNYTNPSAANLASINWTGGAATPAAVSANSIAGDINSYLNAVPANTELSIVRKKGGAMAELKFTDNWKGYAGYSQEHRTGARPFSMNENNYTVEIPEPIDYTTHDLLTGLSYADSLTQANLRASASIFRNNIGTLTVQQPWLATQTGLGAAQTTAFDLYPNNEAFNLKGEFARSFPDLYKSRFTAAAALGTMRQNDDLLMPFSASESKNISDALGSTIVPGVINPGYAANTFNLNNWNGVNGSPLSQSSAKQRIDTKLLNLGLSMKPVDELEVKGDVRYYETDNKGGYTAYNPLTAQFGRGFITSSGSNLVVGSSGAQGATGVPCYVLPGFPAPLGNCLFNGNLGGIAQGAGIASANNPSNVPVVSPARDTKQTNYVLAADYDLGKGSSINGAIERENFYRSYRERSDTWEDKVKIGYVNRGFEEATVRLSYEEAFRRGSTYQFWSVNSYGTGLPGLDWNTILTQYLKAPAPAGWTVTPATLAGYLARYAYESRKYDQADRNQGTLNFRLNLMPRSDMDLGISLQRKDVAYPTSGLGLEKDRMTSFNIDANYQPSTEQQIYAYYSWQDAAKSMRANSGTNAAGANNTCTPTSSNVDVAVAQCAAAIWLPGAMWNLDSRDRNEVLGVGFQSALGTMRLGVDYTYSVSNTAVNYQYGPNVLTAAQALVAGSAFPDMTLIQHSLTANLLVPIEKSVSARLMYRHDSGRIKDWHYSGMPVGASAAENNATAMLDAGPQNYHFNVYGVFLQFKL